jgi:hypothetical protein
MFRLGGNLFERIEIDTVARQEDEIGASGTNSVARCLDIVQDDGVTFDQDRASYLRTMPSHSLSAPLSNKTTNGPLIANDTRQS